MTFTLDRCGREAISWAATTAGHSRNVVRDVMLVALEHRFGDADLVPAEIEWLTDNGSAYIARKIRAFAQQIGLKPVTTPVRSLQSNGMTESFVKTIKRDYVAFMPKPDVPTAMQNLAIAFKHYNERYPHSALKYQSPKEFRQHQNINPRVIRCPALRGKSSRALH
jgi:putative transposase